MRMIMWRRKEKFKNADNSHLNDVDDETFYILTPVQKMLTFDFVKNRENLSQEANTMWLEFEANTTKGEIWRKLFKKTCFQFQKHIFQFRANMFSIFSLQFQANMFSISRKYFFNFEQISPMFAFYKTSALGFLISQSQIQEPKTCC